MQINGIGTDVNSILYGEWEVGANEVSRSTDPLVFTGKVDDRYTSRHTSVVQIQRLKRCIPWKRKNHTGNSVLRGSVLTVVMKNKRTAD